MPRFWLLDDFSFFLVLGNVLDCFVFSVKAFNYQELRVFFGIELYGVIFHVEVAEEFFKVRIHDLIEVLKNTLVFFVVEAAIFVLILYEQVER